MDPQTTRPTGPVFVGRRRELDDGLSTLDEALAGHGRLLLVAGEPGIGKSRLADELATRATERGARVVWGRCWEAGGAPAFWPWVQSLLSLIHGRSPERPRTYAGMAAADLARPALRARLGCLGRWCSLRVNILALGLNAFSGEGPDRKAAGKARPHKWHWEPDMEAVLRGSSWTARRLVAVILGVMAAALLAGGFGGYAIHGGTTVVVTRTVQAPTALAASPAAPYFGTERDSHGRIPGL